MRKGFLAATSDTEMLIDRRNSIHGSELENVDSATLLLMISLMLYCIVGLTGFDPSKQDEAYILGIVFEYVRHGHWVVPMLAGEPFIEKPPLYYLMAGTTAKLFSPWLPLHDAARLASGFCTALTGLIVARTALLLWGGGHGRYAVIALFGSLGFVVPSHMLLTDNASLVGIALALMRLAYTRRSVALAGVALGTGIGVAFLAKGLIGVTVVALMVALLLIFHEWRTRSFAQILLVALGFSLPWLLIWPAVLYYRSPELFVDWIWLNNVGRFFGFAAQRLNIVHEGDFWYRVVPWATFPALPLAVLTLVREGRTRASFSLVRQPALTIPLVLIVAMVLVMSTSASIRAIYAMPLLLAFALMAAPALRALPRWMESVLLWGGILLFVVFALGSFVLWGMLALGLTPPLQALLERILVPGLAMPVQASDGFFALAYCLLWFFCLRFWWRKPWRGAGMWYISLLVIMGVVSQFWVPWVSESKSSYRALYDQMSPFLPREGCIASEGLGESQRGMLHYVLDVKTRSGGLFANPSCVALLVDGDMNSTPGYPGWRLLWSGNRAPDDHEKFWLFVPDQLPDGPKH